MLFMLFYLLFAGLFCWGFSFVCVRFDVLFCFLCYIFFLFCFAFNIRVHYIIQGG